MKKRLIHPLYATLTFAFMLMMAGGHLLAQSFQHPKDQIALQLGAIQMGYTVPFTLTGNISVPKMQQAVNALVMGRNALDATVAKPAVQVVGAVDCPSVDTVEYRDQLYAAVENVVTSPVVATIKGSATLANSKKVTVGTTKLTVPPGAWTIPVPYALEARSCADASGGADLSVLSQNVTTLSTQFSSISSNFTNTTSTVTALSQNLTAVAAALATLSGNLSTLTAQVSSLSSNNSTASLADLAADFTHFKNSAVSSGVVRDYARAIVTTLAGSGSSGSTDGIGAAASFKGELSLWGIDSYGNIYLSDRHPYRKIRKVTSTGVVSTLAGSDSGEILDGIGTAASFDNISKGLVDASGNIYLVDSGRIRKVTPSGVVTTLAGSESSGSTDGTGAAASFSAIVSLSLDSAGNIYVADSYKIRKVTPAGVVTTLAGSGSSGSTDGTGSAASFDFNTMNLDSTVDSSGNVYVGYGAKIRKISPSGVVTTLANLPTGQIYGSGNIRSMVADKFGDIYVLDGLYSWGYRIVKVTSAGVVTTLAGNGSDKPAGSDGVGQYARFGRDLSGLKIDGNGNLYLLDSFNTNSSPTNVIRKITPSGVVSTLAGGASNSIGSDGYGYEVTIPSPYSTFTVDAVGNVYIGDKNASKIRKVTISQ